MRLSDREAAHLIRARLEPLGRTALSIVYAKKSNPESILKAAGYWLDGEMYDRAAYAEDTSNRLKCEATIYKSLGVHPCILKCIGLELTPDGEAWALRLERAPNGNLREFIQQNEPPSMARRVQIAIKLSEALKHIHNHDVIWGDISTRNILVFDDLHIKLSDFTGSTLKDIYPDLLFSYEPRYWVPEGNREPPADGTLAMELFALGTAVCEITEWAIPYGLVEVEEIQQKLLDGEYPTVTKNNPVRDIIQRLWNSEYSSAEEVLNALKIVLDD